MTFSNPLFLRLIIIYFFGIWVVYDIYQSFGESVIFGDLLQNILLIVSGVAFILIGIKDLKEYQLTKNKRSLLPLASGIAFVLTTLSLTYYQYNRLNSPSFLEASWSDGDWNGGTLDLKRNGDYVYSSGSGLGQDFFYGTYSIQDGIILLDRPAFDGFLTSRKLILKTVADTIEQKITYEKHLVMINKNGTENPLKYFRIF
ncbi:MAG: hypothetical protein V4604_02765 [Bacteroidota bacterium]